jgi:enoyl-[acyl-carrier protein] reductase I
MSLLNLTGKRGLVLGIANVHSIAYGCASVFRRAGAEIATTYATPKALPYVQPLAESLEAALFMPCDVQNDQQVADVFSAIQQQWGTLDFVLHSIAFAPKADLQGRVTDCSKDGFLQAMDISCHSFVRLAKHAEPLMANGGSLLTVSYNGSEEVVPHYGMMGPVKAALESATRYLAAELGAKNIRVNALSPSAIMTRAGSGIADFDGLLKETAAKMPLKRMIDLDDIGHMAAFLVSDLAKNITGGVHKIDGGREMMY